MMKPSDQRAKRMAREPWMTLFPLLFGLALLAFLSAIEHENWFHIKPASGTAAAMSYAADTNTSR